MALPLLAIAAIIGAVASIGSTAANVFSQKSANDNNRRISDEVNRTNLKMNEDNNNLQRELANQKYDKDLEQWHRQNAYNTPLSQRNRLLEAGLNPALSQITTGTATSSPELALPTTTPGHVDVGIPEAPVDYSGLGDSVNSTISSVMNMRMMEEQIRGEKIDNDYKGLMNIASLDKMKADTDNSKLRNVFQTKQNNVFEELHNSDMKAREQDYEVKRGQMELNILESARRRTDLAFLGPEKLQQLSKVSAEIAMYKQNMELSRKELDNLVATNEQIKAITKGHDISNSQAEAIKDFIVRQAEYNSFPNQSQWDNKTLWELNNLPKGVGKVNRYGDYVFRSMGKFFDKGLDRAGKISDIFGRKR